jgi:hypothetical protein
VLTSAELAIAPVLVGRGVRRFAPWCRLALLARVQPSADLPIKRIKLRPVLGLLNEYASALYRAQPSIGCRVQEPTESGSTLMLSGMRIRGGPGLIPIDGGSRRRQP